MQIIPSLGLRHFEATSNLLSFAKKSFVTGNNEKEKNGRKVENEIKLCILTAHEKMREPQKVANYQQMAPRLSGELKNCHFVQRCDFSCNILRSQQDTIRHNATILVSTCHNKSQQNIKSWIENLIFFFSVIAATCQDILFGWFKLIEKDLRQWCRDCGTNLFSMIGSCMTSWTRSLVRVLKELLNLETGLKAISTDKHYRRYEKESGSASEK